MRTNLVKNLSVILCAAVAVSGSALALPIHAGDVLNLNGTTVAAEPWLSGPSVDAATFTVFAVFDNGGHPVFVGEFLSQPFRSNTFGTIKINYELRNFQGVVGDRRVVRLEVFGYAGLQANVEYRADSTGDVGPNLVSRTNGDGGQISFIYANPPLLTHLDSFGLHIQTNATFFHEQGFARVVLNTGESAIIGNVHVPTLSSCPGDTNGDGIVNFTDLNTVLSTFGENCP